MMRHHLRVTRPDGPGAEDLQDLHPGLDVVHVHRGHDVALGAVDEARVLGPYHGVQHGVRAVACASVG